MAMKALAAIFTATALLCAFVVGVQVGERRGDHLADQLGQALAAFDSCTAAYGRLTQQLRKAR